MKTRLQLRNAVRLLALAALPLAACSKTTPSGGTPPAKGTGIVPPGVRLEAEMPATAASGAFSFPRAATRTLENGLRVFAVTDSEQPAITVRLVIAGAGSANDPRGRPGVASMTADLLTQGTASRSARDIAEAIDFVGGSISASADDDAVQIGAGVVRKDLALAMDLLSDVLLRPSFRSDELERRRQQALSNLEVQYSDPGYVADILTARAVYLAHPYGLPSSGTPASLAAITRQDLAAFRAAHFAPEQSFLAFAGDLTAEEAFAAAEKYLGPSAWPRLGAKPANPALPEPTKGVRILLVDKPDATQTQIRVGRLGIPRNSPDYIPLSVTNRIFGGGFNSRLSTEVRQKKGLTYGAYSSFNSHAQAGDFSASTFTRTEATVEATRLMVGLMATMSNGSLGPAELDFARDYLAGVFPIQSETGAQVASRILAVAQYNLPDDYNETYQQKVLTVNPSAVAEMAKRYFDASDIVLVLVGNSKEYRDAVRKEFPNASVKELPFDKVDVLAANLQKQ